MEKVPIIHVLAQERWHDPAVIVANRAGLLALKEAVDKALESEIGKANVFCEDGEGYELAVIHRTGLVAHGNSDTPFGYTDEDCCAKDTRPYPDWLIQAFQ